MGADCHTAGGCCSGETDHYEVEVFLKRTRAFNKCELSSTPIVVGENGFGSPRLRYALLQEDFSHIYDTQYGD